jgi:phosphomannomutase
MGDPIITVSGLRGIVGESLTPPVAVRYAGAFVCGLPHGPIVLTRDGRATGTVLGELVRAALCCQGRTVIDADVAATPTTGVLVREHQAAGGLQVSASHNPAAYNGMKLFGADGRVLSAEAGQAVMGRYQSGEIGWSAHDRMGHWQRCTDTVSRHCQLVLETVDVSRIRSRRFRVLLDSNHGAGSQLGQQLLAELGCVVTRLGATPNGQFRHPPEPTPENLADVCQEVTAANAEVGFCQDPDADRLALIDHRGRCISEEYTLAICLNHVLRRRRGPVVTNCSTSRMAQDLAQKYDVPFYHSKVGEANVVDLMQAHGAVFGGEGNGGPIDPQVGYVRDSFVGMAQVLDAMASRQRSLQQLVDELPHYAIVKTKVEVDSDQAGPALARLVRHFRDARPDRMDGLRLDWPDKWLLVRASNTEPIVRVIAEATGEAEAAKLCQEATEVLRGP